MHGICPRAEIEMWQAATEQQKKEMKAASDALLAVKKEKTELLVQLESAREACRASSEAKVGTCRLHWNSRLHQPKKTSRPTVHNADLVLANPSPVLHSAHLMPSKLTLQPCGISYLSLS